MIVLGLDLGTKHPARATLDLSGRKPVLIGSSRGDLSKLPANVRPEASINWLHRELQIAWESGIRTVAIEDPRNTSTQMLRRKASGTRSLLLMLHQFAQADLLAKTLGFEINHVEPRTVSARIGIKLTPKASVAQPLRVKVSLRGKCVLLYARPCNTVVAWLQEC